MSQSDFVALEDVKAYLGGDLQSNDDAVLTRLIAAAGAFIETSCARPIRLADHDETRDGHGGARLHLRYGPVQSVGLVAIDGVAIPQAPSPGGPGWVLSGDTVTLTQPASGVLTGPGASMPVVLTCSPSSSGILSGTVAGSTLGSQNIIVGGTLTVGAGQAQGDYSGSYSVIVTYN